MPPAARAFAELSAAHADAGRHLCVGLDTDPTRIPDGFAAGEAPAARVAAYNAAIVDATAHVAAAYKPNVAFYEALGAAGHEALRATIAHVRAAAPATPVILDAKRADIGSTNLGYVTAAFDELGADAVTVHPYLGGRALQPFLDRTERTIYVLARTSNPGAAEFQDLEVDGLPLYRHVARAVARDWDANGNCGLVVGATYPDELARVREDVGPEMPLLIPGVGAQGGDLEAAVAANGGTPAFLINASRAIIYAGATAGDFADAARVEAERLDAAIRAAAAR
ncbi:MAG TPA: orotidine-5'-phosphate decarboxylase [Solirubrobacteraceae bacterium]|jgi:orotidine-5'-phosphate decarboxylase